MSTPAEVKVKLVFDKSASDAAKKLGEEMKGVGKIVDDTNVKKKGLGATAMGVMKGWGAEARKVLDPMANLRKAGELTKGTLTTMAKVGAGGLVAGLAVGIAGVYSAASAAAEKAERVKALTAQLISFSPNKNVSYGTANEAAKALDREFRQISITTGAMGSEVSKAFQVIGSQTNNAGQAFGQFGGRARLTIEDTRRLTAEMAMASKVVPGGLGQLSDEYEKLKEGVFSSQGAIVQMITTTGVLKGSAVEVAKQLASKDTITRMKLAEEAMHRMSKSAAAMPMGFEGLKNSFSELKGLAFESIGEPMVNALLPKLTSVRDYFAENADKIEMVATKVGTSLAGFVEGGSTIVQALYNAFSGEGSKLGEWIETAFGYAKGAWSWIVENADPLSKTFRDVFNVILVAIEKTFGLVKAAAEKLGIYTADEDKTVTKENFGDFHKGGVKAASSSMMTEKETNLAAQREMSMAKEAGFSKADAQQAANDIYAAQAKFKDATKGFVHGAETLGGAEFVDAYNKAKVEHDGAALAYADSLLKGNMALQIAMTTSGKDIEGGFANLAKSIGDNEFLKLARGIAVGALGSKPMAPQITYNGAVFNIKQDFRDQDPDRVAIVFRNDIAKQAMYRSSSGLGQPFGP